MTAEKSVTIDKAMQDRVLACMQRVPEFMAVASQHIKSEYFEGVPRANVCKVMVDFWKDYSTMVTDPAFMTIMGRLVGEHKIKKVELASHVEKWRQLKTVVITDWKFVLDELVNFIKHQRIRVLINDSITKYLPKNNFADIEREMAKITGITIHNTVESYDYFGEAEIMERQKARETEMKCGKASISTGIKALDDRLHAGGFYQKELYIFMAPPKRGKTMSLLWFSNQASLQGYNVAHFTCEVSRDICAKRLDAMNTKTLIKEVNIYSKAVSDRMISAIPRGKLFLEEHPTKSLTPQVAEAKMDQILREKGIKIDMAVFDYLDIMKFQNADNSAAWADQGPLAMELRRIAGKYSIPVVTATQTNRGAAGKATSGGKDVAGDYNKIMIADEIFTLGATDEELKEGKLRIRNSESRNSEGGTILISTGFAYGQFYKEYLGDEM